MFIIHTRSHPQPHVLYMNYDPTKRGCGTPPLVLALGSEVGTIVPLQFSGVIANTLDISFIFILLVL